MHPRAAVPDLSDRTNSVDCSPRKGIFCISAVAAALGILLTLASISTFAQAQYQLRDLTPDSASDAAEAWAINSSGQVTGTVDRRLGGVPVEYPAFRGDLLSTELLPSLGGYFSLGADINDSGQAGGYSQTASGNFRPAFWDGSAIQDLGSFGGQVGLVSAINNHGWAVGFSDTASGQQHAFVWDGTTMHNLGGLGGEGSSATDINDAGQVVGSATNADGWARPTLWDNLGAHDLGTLADGLGEGWAHRINTAGHVVGRASSFPDGYTHAFFWDGITMHDLGTLGGPESSAIGLNDAGHVFGSANNVPGNFTSSRAFVWDGTTMRDLGTLGGNLAQPADINEASHVVGYSTMADGQLRAFLWDGAVLQDLNSLVDPADPLKPYVTLQSAWAINDRGDVAAEGVDSRIGRLHVYLMSVIRPTEIVLSGFDQPVDAIPTLNKASSGQVIPLRFHVATSAGEPVADLASAEIAVAAMSCSSLDSTGADPIEEYASRNNDFISKGNGDYQFNWATTKEIRGCQVVTLTLPNPYPSVPAKLDAYFQFK